MNNCRYREKGNKSDNHEKRHVVHENYEPRMRKPRMSRRSLMSKMIIDTKIEES